VFLWTAFNRIHILSVHCKGCLLKPTHHQQTHTQTLFTTVYSPEGGTLSGRTVAAGISLHSAFIGACGRGSLGPALCPRKVEVCVRAGSGSPPPRTASPNTPPVQLHLWAHFLWEYKTSFFCCVFVPVSHRARFRWVASEPLLPRH